MANNCCVMRKTHVIVKISAIMMCDFYLIGKTVKYLACLTRKNIN